MGDGFYSIIPFLAVLNDSSKVLALLFYPALILLAWWLLGLLGLSVEFPAR